MSQRLAYYRWEYQDSVHKQYWTAYTVGVYAPTYDRPYISVLVSIANGGGKVLMRVDTVKEAQRRTGMPDTALERLELAETKARGVLEDIRKNLRIISDVRSRTEDIALVNRDTGEIIEEIERHLKREKKE